MKRNPLIPFAAIAVFGIILTVVLSYVSLNQAEKIASEKEGGSGETAVFNPEAFAGKSCITCHGDNLEGKNGAPALKDVGSRLDAAKIKEVLLNGQNNGMMPPGLVPADNVDAMAKWLSEQK
ncbi:MAG: cytochrome c550 [Bacilli bacterium]